MSSTVIVVVADLDNSAHGEINVMESPDKAARLVETLLESGYEQERVRVFTAEEFQMQVHHQPVVSLTMPADRGAEEKKPKTASAKGKGKAGQQEHAPAVEASAASTPAVEEAAEEPFNKDGVRFSSQFRASKS